MLLSTTLTKLNFTHHSKRKLRIWNARLASYIANKCRPVYVICLKYVHGWYQSREHKYMYDCEYNPDKLYFHIFTVRCTPPPPLYNYTAIFVICSIIKPDNIRIIEAVKTG